MPGTPLPRQMQVLHEKARRDHPHAVVHPAGGEQLAHAGVDDRVAGLAAAPRREPVARPGIGVDDEPGELGPQGRPRRLRPPVEHVGVELAPAQLAPERGLVRIVAETGKQLARVDHPEAQVGRQPARAVDRRTVARLGVPVDPAREELLHQLVGGVLAGRRQRGGGRQNGRVALARNLGVSEPLDLVGRRNRGPPAGLLPRPSERREDRVGRSVGLDDRPRRDRVRTVDEGERSARRAEPSRHRGVAPRAVWPVIMGGEDQPGTGLGDDRSYDDGGVAMAHDEATTDRPTECPQTVDQERLAGVARGGEEDRVDHEQRDHRAGRRGGDEGRVVGEAEVTPEPQDHGRRHGEQSADRASRRASRTGPARPARDIAVI